MTTQGNRTEAAQTLGLTRGIKLWLRGVPSDLREAIDPEGGDIELLSSPSAGMDVAVIVIDGETVLDRELQSLLGLMQPAGHVWLLWEGGSVSPEALADRARQDGFLVGDTHRISERWTGLKLDPGG